MKYGSQTSESRFDGFEEIFSAPTKWEQNRLTHSFGTLTVTKDSVSFVPGKVSFLSSEFSIPMHLISGVSKRDNFLWRGAVNIRLTEPFDFRSNFVFFLGGEYREFLKRVGKLIDQADSQSAKAEQGGDAEKEKRTGII